MAHLPTYINKMVFGTSDGKLQLWNIKTRSLIHEFAALGANTSAITKLEAAPNAIDMLAVGFQCGRVALLNCRTDKVVMEFLQEQGSVTALTFRSEPRAPNMLISGSSSGALVCWDLDKKKLAFVREEAHLGAVVEAMDSLDPRGLPDIPFLKRKIGIEVREAC